MLLVCRYCFETSLPTSVTDMDAGRVASVAVISLLVVWAGLNLHRLYEEAERRNRVARAKATSDESEPIDPATSRE